jgi:hypothetical protein
VVIELWAVEACCHSLVIVACLCNSDKYNNSRIYQNKCKDCHKTYVGQTGRKFKTRYKEHIQSIRANNANTKYAQHILDMQHTYGPIADTMDLPHNEKNGRLMNTWEQFYIHKLSKTSTNERHLLRYK